MNYSMYSFLQYKPNKTRVISGTWFGTRTVLIVYKYLPNLHTYLVTHLISIDPLLLLPLPKMTVSF